MLHIQELKMTREFQAFFPVEITAQRHKSHVLFVLFFLRQKKTHNSSQLIRHRVSVL